LALQGVGLARVEADLMPQDKASVFGLLPTLSFSRKQENVAWGLDLSDYALKAIKLSRPVKSDEVKIEACEYILHDMPLSSPDLDKHGSGMVDKTLRDFVDRVGDLKNASIIAGMPGHRVLGRFFELPPMPRKKVSDSIQYEVRHQLPIALEDVCWSQQLLDEVESKAADEQPRRVLVQAAREAQVRDRLSQFKAAGLGVDRIQSDTVALHNALCYEMFATDHAGDEAIALLDLGTISSNIVISSPRCLWFRTFSTGGETFTRELIREFKLTYEQAEQWKREPARARRFHPLQDAMRPLLVQLTSEVERSLAMYARLYADHPVQRLYGLGGGFQAHGVLRHLRSGK